ncbi:PAS domain-containing sensor histidine kinase [Rhizorhabdus sp.]|uniref:PAS domain-containing sensor histidine kinase n=1 Tax=Rhizorhabdus sp. TaxID=1968843 RepID=UPI0025D1964F|nr:PAS domain-containing sensor histidine kinase [Rhizorhabdus sp.]
MHPKGGDTQTRAEHVTQRGWPRLALDRRTIGLSALFAIIIVAAMVKAAYMAPPFSVGDAVMITAMILAGLASGGVMVWSWRTSMPAAPTLARRELMDAADVAAVMIVDGQGIIRHWSRGCEAIYGWPKALAIGRKRVELLHCQTSVPPAELWQTLKSRGSLSQEMVERHRDGRELIIGGNVRLFEHGGDRYSAVVSVTDITEQRRAEDALRLSEARLATAVSVQGIFIYEVDLIERRTIWTTAGDRFFGGEAGAAADHWQGEHARQIGKLVERAVGSGEDRLHFDFDFHHADGMQRFAEGWARIIRDEAGRPIRLLGTHLDVTERRAGEEALRAGEAERRAILATVPDAMFVCNERGVVRACSATAGEMLGYAPDALIGTRLADLIDDQRARKAIHREFLQETAAADRGWPVPVRVCRANGETMPISFVVGDALVEGARIYVVFGRDMRPTIATEERFHRLTNDLAQVSRLGMMGEMAGALAHELSQPLSAIVNFLGAVDLMLDAGAGTDPERLRHAVHRASEQASRAGEIIRRLRAFILRGEADMRGEGLTSLVREAAALALFNSSSFGIRLFYDFESETRLVLCDRIQIQQVLVNLIRNAADAMAAQDGGRRELFISTKMARDNLIEIEVRDSGPGIAPEMLERLFSPFATTKREGLGFGLAISRRIIEAHGGQLSAAASPEVGATFRFTLPVMEDAA